MRLRLYTVFHLNILYSSIAEKEWPALVEKCYWPLLRITEELGAPVGITAPAYTLLQIQRIDPAWVEKLKELWRQGKVEFVGSGYSQIIGPLVPAQVNEQNLRIGHEVYEQLLGRKPMLAYVNEQTYSQSLIGHYLKAGYEAIIMEWNNPRKAHPEWNKEWQQYPQEALDQQGRRILLVWNNSIAFQKFQRYAHGEIELSEYIDYLKLHTGFLPLYGSDIEVFDYRPGRYQTEAALHKQGEWNRIRELLRVILKDTAFKICLPSDVLSSKTKRHALRLESASQPIPVKKQEKYTAARWGVTGRDDIGLNTACYRIYEHLKRSGADSEQWKELCYLWSSDFRTHVEEKKWNNLCLRLKQLTPVQKKSLA